MNIWKIGFLSLILFSNITYSESRIGNIKIHLSKSNIIKCEFEQDYMDFCTDKYLRLYEKKMNDTPNFSIDKILLVLDKERDTGKGIPRIVKHVVVLDPKNNKVYPLQQSVGFYVDDRLNEIYSDPPKVDFSKKDNKVCLSGTTYSLHSSNINVENECYLFNEKEKNYFKRVVGEYRYKNKSIELRDGIFPIFSENNKIICNKRKCKEVALSGQKLKAISKGGDDSALRFLVNERGFDTTYIDLSSGNINMYLIEYTEGESKYKNAYIAYFLNDSFKVKFLGIMKKIKILNSQNIYFNGVKVNLN